MRLGLLAGRRVVLLAEVWGMGACCTPHSCSGPSLDVTGLPACLLLPWWLHAYNGTGSGLSQDGTRHPLHAWHA